MSFAHCGRDKNECNGLSHVVFVLTRVSGNWKDGRTQIELRIDHRMLRADRCMMICGDAAVEEEEDEEDEEEEEEEEELSFRSQEILQKLQMETAPRKREGKRDERKSGRERERERERERGDSETSFRAYLASWM